MSLYAGSKLVICVTPPHLQLFFQLVSIVDCTHPQRENCPCSSVKNVPSAEGQPTAQWRRPRLQSASCSLFAGHSIPLASPSPLPHTDTRSLFIIYLFPSMWSKRLMKQHGVWYLCRNNNMEMVFRGQCVALAAAAIELTAVKWLAAEGIDCPEWFTFFSSFQPRRVTSRARPYLCVVSRLYERLGASAFHDRNRSIWIGRCHFLICFAFECRGFIRLRLFGPRTGLSFFPPAFQMHTWMMIITIQDSRRTWPCKPTVLRKDRCENSTITEDPCAVGKEKQTSKSQIWSETKQENVFFW